MLNEIIVIGLSASFLTQLIVKENFLHVQQMWTWLTHKSKPFSCAFCMSFWWSVLLVVMLYGSDSLLVWNAWQLPFYVLGSACVSYLAFALAENLSTIILRG